NTIRVSERSTDLHKIAEVNSISRKIDEGDLDALEAFRLLKEIEKAELNFPKWIQTIAAALLSGCFTIMFGGMWPDFVPTLITGGLGYAAMLGIMYLVDIRLIA